MCPEVDLRHTTLDARGVGPDGAHGEERRRVWIPTQIQSPTAAPPTTVSRSPVMP